MNASPRPAPADHRLRRFRVRRFEYPRDRVIGDSQVRIATSWIGTVELFDDAGRSGLGFFQSLLQPLPPVDYLDALFATDLFPALANQTPAALVHRVTRPRGGNFRPAGYLLGEAVDQALWDLAAKHHDLPLFRYLGGDRNRVPAYASGLCFHLSEQDVRDLYRRAVRLGFDAYKVKVGFPTIEEDLRRLAIVREAVGSAARLMIDANEAWTPRETLTRLNAYASAGFPIYWVEDPVLRHDFEGLRLVRAGLRGTLLNTGEYLDVTGKLQLLAQGAVDVLNLHGHISESLRLAWLCGQSGTPVSLGNTLMNIGAHVASALPEVLGAEYSLLNNDHLVQSPIRIEQGHFVLDETPGHGLTLSSGALQA